MDPRDDLDPTETVWNSVDTTPLNTAWSTVDTTYYVPVVTPPTTGGQFAGLLLGYMI